MSVATGPAIVDPVYPSVMDVGFRVLVDYRIGTDAHLVRLDWLKSGVQVHGTFHARQVHDARDRDMELMMPKSHVGFSVVANADDVIGALRGMADRLEQQVKVDAAKKAKP